MFCLNLNDTSISFTVKRIFKFLISAFYFLIRSILMYFLSFFKFKLKGFCVVLYFHEIDYHSRNRFEKMMVLLRKKTNTISFTKDIELEKGEIYSFLTFDDGFVSFINNAWPIINKIRIPTIIFVPSGYLGKEPTWEIEGIEIPEDEVVLSEEQLADLSNNILITVGSHSISHPNFALLNITEAQKELLESKKYIEKLINTDVNCFSFPYGSYFESHLELCRKAGYKYVFNSIPVNNYFKSKDFVIGRIPVDTNDWFIEFWLKIQGAYGWLPVVIKIKQKLFNIREYYKYRIK